MAEPSIVGPIMSPHRVFAIVAVTIACLLGLVVIWIVISIERGGILAFQSNHSGDIVIKYPGFWFYEYKGSVSGLELLVDDDDKVPPLFLRFPAEPARVYRLPSMTPEDVSSFAQFVEKSTAIDGTPIVHYGLGNRSSVSYRGGTLYMLVIAGDGISVSRSRSGPFVEMPTNRTSVRKVFGEPLEYQRQTRAFH